MYKLPSTARFDDTRVLVPEPLAQSDPAALTMCAPPPHTSFLQPTRPPPEQAGAAVTCPGLPTVQTCTSSARSDSHRTWTPARGSCTDSPLEVSGARGWIAAETRQGLGWPHRNAWQQRLQAGLRRCHSP